PRREYPPGSEGALRPGPEQVPFVEPAQAWPGRHRDRSCRESTGSAGGTARARSAYPSIMAKSRGGARNAVKNRFEPRMNTDTHGSENRGFVLIRVHPWLCFFAAYFSFWALSKSSLSCWVIFSATSELAPRNLAPRLSWVVD